AVGALSAPAAASGALPSPGHLRRGSLAQTPAPLERGRRGRCPELRRFGHAGEVAGDEPVDLERRHAQTVTRNTGVTERRAQPVGVEPLERRLPGGLRSTVRTRVSADICVIT